MAFKLAWWKKKTFLVNCRLDRYRAPLSALANDLGRRSFVSWATTMHFASFTFIPKLTVTLLTLAPGVR